MRIEIELGGYGAASQFLCNSLGDMRYNFNGWANYDTGEVLRKKKRRGRPPKHYPSPGEGWHEAIIRPQECIDKHGL